MAAADQHEGYETVIDSAAALGGWLLILTVHHKVNMRHIGVQV